MSAISPSALWHNKGHQVVLFSSVAIALYGYDQGMMSLVNTNYDYLYTMGIGEKSPLVGVIVSIYYIGCAVGAVLASNAADKYGRKLSIFTCLALSSIGNILMFVSGYGPAMGPGPRALACMFVGRITMGLGIGGIDAIVPVYSSELSSDDARGKSIAKEFQANILGLNLAFGVNLAVTHAFGKYNQVFPLTLMAIIGSLPESPRYHIMHDRKESAEESLSQLFHEEEERKKQMKTLVEGHEHESDASVSYWEMLFSPSSEQFHPTMLTVMGQINQAFTGYGAVSVYGPQIFQLLGLEKMTSEYVTMANYISYFLLMTFTWLLIDAVGRRAQMLWGSLVLTTCFLLLTIFGGLAMNSGDIHIPTLAVGIPGVVVLFVATGAFGIGWLPQAVSVIIWGLANFTITLLTPLLFNNLKYWLFLIFAATNAFAGWFTWTYQPETGNRPFEDNQQFFKDAREAGTWDVANVSNGEFLYFPGATKKSGTEEEEPLLSRIRQQID